MTYVMGSGRRKYRIADWLLASLVIISIYGGFITKTIGIDSLYIQVVLIAGLFAVTIKQGISINRRIVIPFFLCLSICAVQSFMHLPNIEPIRNLMYMIVFLLAANVTRNTTWKLMKKVLILMSIIMTVDALVKLPVVIANGLNWYNIRKYTAVDKPAYSLILTFSIILMSLDILFKQTKHPLLDAGLILLELIVNIVIVQSKASILCIIAALVVIVFMLPRKIRKRLLIIMAAAVAVVFYICIFRPDLIPEYIKVLANVTFGWFGDSINDFGKYSTTYSLRGKIYESAFALILESPLLGIGFGNYAQLGKNAFGISETESSILNTFVEGGVIYGISHLAIVLMIIVGLNKRSRRKYPIHVGREMLDALVVLLLYLIFNFQNDYISTMYWCILGVFSRVTYMSYRHEG